MNTMKYKQTALAALAALALACSSNITRAADDIIVGPTGTQADISGTSPDFEWQNMWGPAFVSITFDAATPPPSGDTAGSIYIQGNWPGSAADNFCIGSPGNWWGALTFDASLYESIEMDVKYDTSSTISPASAAHLQIGFDQGYSFTSVTNCSFDTGSSALADGQWHHLSISVPLSINAPNSHSVGFYQWNPDGTAGTMNFWVANVVVVARVVPLAPPTVTLHPAVPGLTQFADKPASYNRQDIRTDQSGTAAVTWYGQPKPVSYSWKIAAFPSATYSNFFCGLTFTPDDVASQTYADPDWSATNCLWIGMQNNADGTTTAGIAWKTNEPVGNNQLFYAGQLVAYNNETNGLTVPSAIGTWTVTFTSDTELTLTAPNGASTNTVLDASFAALFNGYVGAYLYSTPAVDANIGQSVTLSQFKITGVGTPVNEDLTSGALSSPFLMLYSQAYTGYSNNPPNQIFITSSDPYWLSWTLPATSFSPISSASLSSPVWNDITGTTLPVGATIVEKVSNAQLPGAGSGFFAMIKRTFTQLQVLLPGQTNAPGTVSGYTGTPTPISLAAQGLTPTTVIVNACDDQWHIISGVSDQIHLTTTDSGAYLPADLNMVNGTATFSDADGVLFQTEGSQTVTAQDLTSTTVTNSATSAAVTVEP